MPHGHIDIWRTALDGSGRSQRLTYFSDFAGFGANNPVVSPDGLWMAFQLRAVDGPHGNGQGVFLFDLRRAPDEHAMPEPRRAERPNRK
jgi:Tol biopolymer transport system component